MRKWSIYACSLVMLVAIASPVAGQTTRPNIIFILADDLGIGNIGSYGADNFKTPHLDRLAQGGVRFERTFSAPLCGPSRALLLTGRYAFRTGMTGNDSGPLISPAKEVMTPALLKSAGYATVQIGKWSQLPLQPVDFGFDEYLRFKGSGTYWNTQERGQSYTVNGRDRVLANGEYLPDLMHEFLVEFMTRRRDQPFYAYYSLSHVHNDILRTPDSAPDSKDLYADNIAYMDKLIGRLVADLERLKLRERTLLIFVGDNGTVPREAARSTIRGRRINGAKGSMQEGGSLVPMIASWPGTIPPGRVISDLIDFSDFYPTLAAAAGVRLPQGVTIDGQSFLPQLRGARGNPREAIFVELGRHWYVREQGWKLDEAGQLFNMRNAPYEEELVTAPTADATAARKRLQARLDKLNPAGGILDPGDGSGRHARNVRREQEEREKK